MHCKYLKLSTVFDTVLIVSSCFLKKNALVKAFMKHLNLNPGFCQDLSLNNQGKKMKV